MKRAFLLIIVISAALSACASAPTDQAAGFGPDGNPLPRIYRIAKSDEGRIQFRVLDSVNALRQAAGAPPVALNARLNAAAATHSRDMAVQNRPWHFGSDGSSPIDRVQRVGYGGQLVGETISETFETELQTLSAWMETDETRRIILDGRARDLGISWFQESNGKIWWTMILGAPGAALVPGVNQIAATQ